MSLRQRTRLICDICGNAVAWESAVSKTVARSVAKRQYGWRTDKLNRDVCGAHLTLFPQKQGRQEK